MQALDQLAMYHGVWIALALLLAGIGVPLPMSPVLLAAGALAHMGRINTAAAVLIAPLCLTVGDALWYFAGQKYGQKILGTVCRISLERDVCIRKTQDTFMRHGVRVLLFSRFVPGLSTLAAPMAGAAGIRFPRFLSFEFAGTFIYSSAYMLLGYLFADQLDRILDIFTSAGTRLSVAAGIAFGLYVAVKLFMRYWLIRQANTLALHAAEVEKKRAAEPRLLLVDLRGPNDLAADPFAIPGARLLREKELMQLVDTLTPDLPIVLFCACPNQASSTRVALALRRRGFAHVWPMRDGIAGWRAANLPLEPWQAPTQTGDGHSIPLPVSLA